jgi:DNA integrity scanning protein DisA with diadenylate cyclase activity
MEIELHPAVSLLPETFNVLVAPVEMMVEALNSHINLQRYKVLYVSGKYSRILSRLDRNFTELEIRRAFTSFQLMTILERNGFDYDLVEDLKGHVVQLPKHAKYAQILKNSVAFKETANERIFLMKDLAAVEEAVSLGAKIVEGEVAF